MSEVVTESTLYIVSTPIGHLGDMTYRAVHILKSVDLILCEDTRTSSKLFSMYDIQTPYKSFHMHSEYEKSDDVIELLKEGKKIALITDAGTPLISDPGYVLVSKVKDHHLKVVPIGGVSAVLNALVASGIKTQPFWFEGFLPKTSMQLKHRLETLKTIEATLIFYESPNRVSKTIQQLLEVFGNRDMTLAREMTKKHETFTYTTLKEASLMTLDTRGEYVIVVAPYEKVPETIEQLPSLMEKLLKEGLSEKDAMKQAALALNVSKKEVYQHYKIKA
jgi:16S rRNA (cytidine1402-2'-O)-methyltransferase